MYASLVRIHNFLQAGGQKGTTSTRVPKKFAKYILEELKKNYETQPAGRVDMDDEADSDPDTQKEPTPLECVRLLLADGRLNSTDRVYIEKDKFYDPAVDTLRFLRNAYGFTGDTELEDAAYIVLIALYENATASYDGHCTYPVNWERAMSGYATYAASH
jgi:hypothetical protein